MAASTAALTGTNPSDRHIPLTMSTPPPPSITNRSASNVTSPPRQLRWECDYDLNPTFLYQAIEAREWDHVKEVFDKSNAHDQVVTWVTRKEVNGKLRWRLLPIHAAIIFKSPLEIVELLLQEYPESSQCKDDQGMLPLHLAFRNGSDWDILEELLISNPQGVAVKDRKGRTPIQCANAATQKQASVVELYTQISVSAERQRLAHESRSMLGSRVAALQNTHNKSLASLKEECQSKIEDLEQCLILKEEELVGLRQSQAQSKKLFEEKELAEKELTSKLEEVSMALETMSKTRAAEDSLAQKKHLAREKVLKDANDELLLLVQKLLGQQNSLKVALDKQTWEAEGKVHQVKSAVKNATSHHKKAKDDPARERDVLRGFLEESSQDASNRLSSVLEKTRLLGEVEVDAVESALSFESNLPGLERTRPIGISFESTLPGLERTRPIGSFITLDETKDEQFLSG